MKKWMLQTDAYRDSTQTHLLENASIVVDHTRAFNRLPLYASRINR